MPLTAEQKKAKIEELREAVKKYQLDTFSIWLMLFEIPEEDRKHAGYSKGAEDMIQKLVKDYRKKQKEMMKPFDRGDYD